MAGKQVLYFDHDIHVKDEEYDSKINNMHQFYISYARK